MTKLGSLLLLCGLTSVSFCSQAFAQQAQNQNDFFGGKDVSGGFFDKGFVPTNKKASNTNAGPRSDGGDDEGNSNAITEQYPARRQANQKAEPPLPEQNEQPKTTESAPASTGAKDDFSFGFGGGGNQSSAQSSSAAGVPAPSQQNINANPQNAAEIKNRIADVIKQVRSNQGNLPQDLRQGIAPSAIGVDNLKGAETKPAVSNEANVAPAAQVDSSSAQFGPPVLSLVLNANPPEHFESNIKELLRVHNNFNVPIGQIVVVGMLDGELEHYLNMEKTVEDENDVQKVFTNSPQDSLMIENHLEPAGSVDFEKLMQRLGVSTSPTWIVRSGGKDYVYEGINNPSRLFTAKGEFKDATEQYDARQVGNEQR